MVRKESLKNFVVKLQGLPENHKKIILYLIAGTLALSLGFFWLKITAERIRNFQTGKFIENLNFPNLEGSLTTPEIGNKGELEKVENLIKVLEENPEKLKELEKMVEDNPDRASELLINPDKLEEFLNF